MNRSRTARLLKSLSLWVLIALIGGLLVGAAAQNWGVTEGAGAFAVVEGLGQLWLNALRMTIIPLVFSLLVTGIASIADAAATGRLALKAVVVFAIVFGFATTRLPERLRQPLTTFFEAVSETMVVIVHWVLLAAPFGVFALSVGVGLRAGLGAAGVLGHYVALVVLALIGLILLTYVVVVAFGRLGLARFAGAVAPAQVVAFSTQSSLACLPVMVDRAKTALGVSSATAGLVLPLAVAVFRITSPVANLAVCIYVAHLHGIALSPGVLMAGGIAALAISVGTVGLPGQVSFFASIAPIALAMGLPLEVLPLLLAVEVVPDIFRTIGNVTADLAAARIVEGGDAAGAAAEA